jgi:hypothetical protein
MSNVHAIDFNKPYTVEEFFSMGGKVVVVLFYGRKKFVHLQVPQLKAVRRSKSSPNHVHYRVVDHVIVAVNTKVKEDLDYLDEFIDNEYFIRKDLTDIGENVWGFCGVFNEVKADSNTLFVKLDDDVIYMHEHAILHLLRFKLTHPYVMLASANVINHSMLAYVHARTGVFLKLFGANSTASNDPLTKFHYTYGYKSANSVQLQSGGPAVIQLEILLDQIKNNRVMETYHTFSVWDFNAIGFESAWSVNMYIYNPADVKFDLRECVKVGDEAYFSETWPKRLNRHSVAVGNAIVAHYSYNTQRNDGILEKSGILKKYQDYFYHTSSTRR